MAKNAQHFTQLARQTLRAAGLDHLLALPQGGEILHVATMCAMLGYTECLQDRLDASRKNDENDLYSADDPRGATPVGESPQEGARREVREVLDDRAPAFQL